jgi:hypothetical protein
MQHRDYLLQMTEKLLREEWSVPDFRTRYYDFYLEKAQDDALSEANWDFFGAIQEKLDWIDEKPDPESKNYGWLNHDQYVLWARVRYAGYVKRQGLREE